MNVYRVWGLGVLGLRLRVQGLEFGLKVQGLGVLGLRLRVQGLEFGLKVQSFWFSFGLRFRVKLVGVGFTVQATV